MNQEHTKNNSLQQPPLPLVDDVSQSGQKIKIVRRKTREVPIGNFGIGGSFPISVQSMCATRTQDIEETLNQIRILEEHGADFIRIAVDSKKDVEALGQLRKQTSARLVVDLQENYRLIALVAPYVQKVRYNPGHLHHHEKEVPVFEKVKFIVETAHKHDCALRIGVNFGSLDPEKLSSESHTDGSNVTQNDPISAALESVNEHINYMGTLNFNRFVVSLKSSNPNDVIEINKKFSEQHPDIPIHLGVTEAGLLPMGEIKTRIAFENLLALGIGDTVRVSLTVPFSKKYEEILVGKKIIDDVFAGRFRSVPKFEQSGMNIISCPSCSRVENTAFVELAEKVRELTEYASKECITIAVMGCRVNGPGETDDADLGLWCAPKHVNLKKKKEFIGAFGYDEVLLKLKEELDSIIREKNSTAKSL
jgi:(E)-4-hydroxy-3-methylbut-2-enyl-diphosphate synthase